MIKIPLIGSARLLPATSGTLNGDQVNRMTTLTLKRGKSVDFTGYWQRHIAD